ncbi:hypothetical protein niasHT_015447 [Heterodera trifolii]|uniref:ABC-type glutathione-S-conjugate transporter n=1 Tax=Heterodera trifolii TaxID=157864 RepID=A0ABD2KZX7_9BILA
MCKKTKIADGSPKLNASFFSRLFYSWFGPILQIGRKRPLTEHDLFELDTDNKCHFLTAQWEKLWLPAAEKYQERRRHKYFIWRTRKRGLMPKRSFDSECAVPMPSIVFTLFKLFKYDLLVAGLVKLFYDILLFANPLLLNLLVNFISDPNAHLWQGICYSLAIFLCSEIRSICVNYHYDVMFQMGAKVQSLLTMAIYKKSFKLSNGTRRDRTAGEIVNLMSIDVERFQIIAPYIQQFWSSPFQIAISLVILFKLLGIAALPGFLIMAVILPLSFVSSFFTRTWLTTQMNLRDERAKLLNEILNGIKVIKLYAWEIPMLKAVGSIRRLELRCMFKIGVIRSLLDMLNFTSPFLVAVASFTTFILLDPAGGRSLTPQIAFVSLTLFNQIRSPMTMIGMLINYVVQTTVSNKRIREFLLEDELERNAIEQRKTPNVTPPLIRVISADFCWDNNGKNGKSKEGHPQNGRRRTSFVWNQHKATELPTLTDIGMEIRREKLVAIVGKVGAGKSSLLAALLGEMKRTKGELKMLEGMELAVASVPQLPWIQNLSLRNNILFGQPFEEEWYERVLDACALRADLEMLPQGDATEIGEKGINLSGGQKARVSLARAVYQRNSELYLLDDPLSAVDSHVGKWIFEKVIGPGGLLDGKSRIFVTHGLHFLHHVDLILLVQDGRIVERGTFDELSSMLGGKFAQFVAESKKNGEKIGNGTNGQRTAVNYDIEPGVSNNDSDVEPLSGRVTTATSSNATGEQTLPNGNTPLPKRLIQKERVETGRVKLMVYLQYFRVAGWSFSLLFLMLFVLNQCMQMSRNFWLSDWADHNQQDLNSSITSNVSSYGLSERLIVYAAFGTAEALFFLLGLWMLLIAGLNASRNLYSPLLRRVIRAPMAFFDTTPIGRLLNRFGRDIEVADGTLPMNIRYFVQCISMVMATLVTICISTWLFVVLIVPLFLCYLYILLLYVPISRQLKRMESNRRSPIYSHFSESLQGAPTIRAFHRQENFCAKLEYRVDRLMRIRSLSLVANRWLGIRLEFVGNCVTLFAALFAVLSHHWNLMTSAGLVGLSVSNALNITEVMNFATRQISELETNIVSIERLKEYSEVETEAPWRINGKRPPRGWPQKGQIVFDHYSTRYRPGLELVLWNVITTVRPSEKVGIVGRTGAGKSSLTLALFRLVEPATGSIVIDGVNINEIGLHDLRSNLTIIPQEPVLFSGTFRFNLDPFNTHSDDQLWQVLEHSHLRDFVAQLPGGLDYQISEGGENISIGQRQLLCLARALLRFSRILVLDEATAAVDLTTDALIQETIRREFRHCTVITIAHRIATILDYDRVAVLHNGQIQEFDSPDNLLADQNSMFSSMVADSRVGRHL